MRGIEGSALDEILLAMMLESTCRNDVDLAGKHRLVPIPFLREARGGIKDQCTKAGKHRAAPVSQACDMVSDTLRGSHTVIRLCGVHTFPFQTSRRWVPSAVVIENLRAALIRASAIRRSQVSVYSMTLYSPQRRVSDWDKSRIVLTIDTNTWESKIL